MNTITLRVHRKKAFTGMAMPYAIKIDGVKKGTVRNGGSMEIEIPNHNCVLMIDMVGNFLNLHKIREEVVLFPEHCTTGVIECEVETKYNPLGGLTLGLLQAVGKLSLNINYNAK
ncbi:MAG: hypothetical protein KBT67_01800 [bacterium]|nr:hypothetical protein [Candidatus Limimorpha caballi]